jgi:hypothetical protein
MGVELSLTVPITNSLAFLFTVLGEWIAEGKSISRGVFALLKFPADVARHLDRNGLGSVWNCDMCSVKELKYPITCA